MKPSRNTKSGRRAALRKSSSNDQVGGHRSRSEGRDPALEIRYRPGEAVEVRIVAGDEEGEIEILEALEEREVGLAIAAAVWRFAAERGLIDEVGDFDPMTLLRLPMRRAS